MQWGAIDNVGFFVRNTAGGAGAKDTTVGSIAIAKQNVDDSLASLHTVLAATALATNGGGGSGGGAGVVSSYRVKKAEAAMDDTGGGGVDDVEAVRAKLARGEGPVALNSGSAVHRPTDRLDRRRLADRPRLTHRPTDPPTDPPDED